MTGIRQKINEVAAKAEAFNRAPPVWAYWVTGILVYLAIQFVRFL